MSAPTKSRIRKACEQLAAADPALARAYAEIGVPEWRARSRRYATLATTIAYQQISTKAAASIWGRVTDALPDLEPVTFLEATEDELRALGLSRPKIRHLKSIAAAIDTGALDLDRVAAASLEEARQELLQVSGIGPWTAELFLLYALGEMNAFPTADVGLMESYRLLAGDEARMDAKSFSAHAAQHWQPWRGVGAHLLWGWLNAERAKA